MFFMYSEFLNMKVLSGLKPIAAMSWRSDCVICSIFSWVRSFLNRNFSSSGICM